MIGLILGDTNFPNEILKTVRKKKINYLKKIGWKKNKPCFYKIELNENIPKKYLNVSAKKIHSKKKIDYFKKYIKDNTPRYNIIYQQ